MGPNVLMTDSCRCQIEIDFAVWYFQTQPLAIR